MLERWLMVKCDECRQEFDSNQKFLQDVIDGTAERVLCPVCQAVAAYNRGEQEASEKAARTLKRLADEYDCRPAARLTGKVVQTPPEEHVPTDDVMEEITTVTPDEYLTMCLDGYKAGTLILDPEDERLLLLWEAGLSCLTPSYES